MRRGVLRRVLLGLAGLAGLLLLLAILAFTLLQTDWGRQRLLASLGDAAGVRLEGLRGTVPFDMVLDRLAIADPQGIWLEAEDVHLAWRPSRLVGGRLSVEELTAARIAMPRTPAGPEEPEKKKPGHPSGFNIPPVSVDILRVDRLELGPPLLGGKMTEPVALRLEGSAREVAGGMAAHLAASRLEGPSTTLVLDAELSDTGPSGVLRLDLQLLEEPHGLVAALAGLPGTGPLSLSVSGSGPVRDWRGQLAAEAGGMGRATGEATLSYRGPDETTTLGLHGTLALAQGYGPPALRTFLPGETPFAVDIGLTPDQRIVVDRLQISFPQPAPRSCLDGVLLAQLETGVPVGAGQAMPAPGVIRTPVGEVLVTGQYDLANSTLDFHLALSRGDLAPLSELAGTDLAGTFSAEGTVRGPVSQPRAEASATFAGLRAGEIRIDGGQAEAAGSLLGPLGETFPGARAEVRARLAGITVPARGRIPEEEVRLVLAGTYRSPEDTVLERLEADGRSFNLTAEGRTAPGNREDTAKATLEVRDLAPLAGWLGRPLTGSALATAALAGDFVHGDLSGKVQASLRRPGGLPAPAADLTGNSADLATGFQVRAWRLFEARDLTLDTQRAHLTLNGSYDTGSGNVAADLHGRVPDLSPLSASTGTPLAGSARLEAKISGSAQALQLAADLAADNPAYGDTRLERITTRIEVAGVPAEPAGRLAVTARGSGVPFEAGTGFRLAGDLLRLSDLDVRTTGLQATGGGTVNLATRLAEVGLEARIDDLAPLGRLLGQDLAGNGRAAVTLAAPGSRQSVAATATLSGLRAAGTSIAGLRLKADLQDVMATPKGTADITATGLAVGQATFENLTASVDGDAGALRFRASGRGRAAEPLAFRTEGAYRPATEGNEAAAVTLAALQGTFGQYPFRLARPMEVRFGGGLTEARDLRLEFGPGVLEGNALLKPEAVTADLEARDIPAGMLAMIGLPPLAGTLSATAHASGAPDAPTVRAGLDATGLKVRDPAYADLPSLALAARTEYAGGQVRATAEIRGLGGEPARAEVRVPARLSLAPFAFDLPPDAPLAGGIEGRIDLARLQGTLPLRNQRITGTLDLAMDIGGTVAVPAPTGRVRLTDGVYENAASGTMLRNIRMEIESDGRELLIRSLTATDGGTGTIEGRGRVGLAPGEPFPFTVETTIRKARLFRTDMATGLTSGALVVAGDSSGALLSGSLEVGPAEITVPETSAPAIAKLNVVEVNGPAAASARNGTTRNGGAAPAFVLRLDVAVTLPGRVFVRGRGLDSEWEGALRVTGTATEPVVAGQLSVVRGTFTFLDRRLAIEHGTVRLSGAVPPEPVLDILAQTRTGDITAQVNILGTPANPDIRLTSDPPLPQDEVLSRLLFGRSLRDITPLQALQLARAVSELTGVGRKKGGGGLDLDVIGSTRRFLRLDELAISQDQPTGTAPPPGTPPGAARHTTNQATPGGTTIGAGKYLADDVFVKAEQNVTTSTSRFIVEYELTPNISLESSVGTNSTTGLGINWKFDY